MSETFIHKFVFSLPLVCMAMSLCAAEKPELRAMVSDDDFPFSFRRNGVIQGIGIDVAKELAVRSGLNISIEVVPWKRAVKTAEALPNAMIVNIVRTAERESSFVWLGPIAPNEDWLYRLTSRDDLLIKSIADIAGMKVGEIDGSYIVPLLKKQGAIVDLGPDDQHNCYKLKAHRVDFMVIDPLRVPYVLKTCGLTQREIKKAALVSNNSWSYMGLSKSTPTEIVAKLTTNMDQLIADGTLNKIKGKWVLTSASD